MLDVKVTVNLESLNALSKTGIESAIDRGLTRIAKNIYQEAFHWLSGSGAEPPGAYPVPVRTGHLRRSLDWLKPGTSKHTEVGAFRAGTHEIMVYDSALYAMKIHAGSNGYKKRPFLEDALKGIGDIKGVERIMDEELDKEIERHT